MIGVSRKGQGTFTACTTRYTSWTLTLLTPQAPPTLGFPHHALQLVRRAAGAGAALEAKGSLGLARIGAAANRRLPRAPDASYIHHVLQLVRRAAGGGAALEAKGRMGVALRVGALISVHPALALDEEARHAAAQASLNRVIQKSQLLEGLQRLGCDAELLRPDAVLTAPRRRAPRL